MIPSEAEYTLRSLIAGGSRKLYKQLEDGIVLSRQLAVFLTGGMRILVVMC